MTRKQIDWLLINIEKYNELGQEYGELRNILEADLDQASRKFYDLKLKRVVEKSNLLYNELFNMITDLEGDE